MSGEENVPQVSRGGGPFDHANAIYVLLKRLAAVEAHREAVDARLAAVLKEVDAVRAQIKEKA